MWKIVCEKKRQCVSVHSDSSIGITYLGVYWRKLENVLYKCLSIFIILLLIIIIFDLI